jgi:hypothetical protein
VATWNGTWASAATYRNNAIAGEYWESTFIVRSANGTSGTIVLWSNTDHSLGGGDGVEVKLNGVVQGTWNQATGTQSYPLSSLVDGACTVRCTTAGAVHTQRIGHIIVSQYPYQGCGVSGDAGMLLTPLREIMVTTLGTGPTLGAGTGSCEAFSEALTPHLPRPTGLADTGFLKESMAIAGWTNPGVMATGYLLTPVLSARGSTGFGNRAWVRVGATYTLADAATRGFAQGIANIGFLYSPSLSASVTATRFVATIVRITAVGAGSQFEVGDLALMIGVRDGVSADNNWAIQVAGAATMAMDFYKIPASLF